VVQVCATRLSRGRSPGRWRVRVRESREDASGGEHNLPVAFSPHPNPLPDYPLRTRDARKEECETASGGSAVLVGLREDASDGRRRSG